jgi:adenylate cyclase
MSQRQLAAIMFTDLVGYSALAERNEALALEVLEKHWELLRSVFAKFDGHEIKTIGDAFLIEFPSTLRAVEAGLAIQSTLEDHNRNIEEDHKIHLRIGIHTGDVERREDDVFGEGVNIASRIESLAPSGGLCISESVYSAVRNKIDVPFYSMGEQKLKNISHPVVVYSNHSQHIPAKTKKQSTPSRLPIKTILVLLTLIVIVWITNDDQPPVTRTAEIHTVDKIEPEFEPVATADRKSVAVLPFTNRSKSEDDAYFADGLHDDLLTHLSKITDMKVISRTSVMGYRDTTKNMKVIGSELGVATLLEGSVQRVTNQVRINVQLIDVNTDEHIWAEIYDRELTAANIFAIQSEISTAIAKALRATLSPEEQERLAVVPTNNLAAYEAYLLGKQRMVTRTSEKLAEAAAYFEQAITLDPTFALAHVGLSDTAQLQFLYAGLPQDEMNALAESSIQKALALDEKSGEAYASLGLFKLERYDYEGAEVAFKKALELNPNYATAYHWYGSLFAERGQVEEAEVQMQKALALDPLSIVINTNVAFYHTQFGKFDEAMRLFEKIIKINPTAAQGYLGKARLYWAVYGRLDEAVPWMRKAVSLDPNSPQYNAFFGGLYLALGDEVRAECWIDRAMKVGPESIMPNLLKAYLHLVRNEDEQAFSIIPKVLNIDPTNGNALTFLSGRHIKAANYEKARAVYEQAFPALLEDDEPEINRANYREALDLAYVLQLNGELERADMLLESSLAYIRSGITRLDFGGYKINDVRIYAMQGEKQQALTSLRRAIDEGWRDAWWYFMEIDPSLGSIRNEPEFQSMLAEIKADMAEQLSRVKAMEKEGDVCVSR